MRRGSAAVRISGTPQGCRRSAAILTALEDRLHQGSKALVGNRGFRRYLKVEGEGFQLDLQRVEAEARYDGKWVLITNTDYSPADVALAYKQLWMVEDLFRSMKSLLATRPIYHRCDETIRGHVFCSSSPCNCAPSWRIDWRPKDTSPWSGPTSLAILTGLRRWSLKRTASAYCCVQRRQG